MDLPSGFYITCAGKRDGGGAQIHAIYSTMLYAACHGLTYLHLPLQSVDHNTLHDEDWAGQWEQAFSPGEGELWLTAFDLRRARLVSGEEMRIAQKKPPSEALLLVALECHGYADAYPDHYALIQPLLLQKYGRVPRPARPASHMLYIAIHVRRGDVSEQTAERFTPNAVVLAQIEQLSRMLSSLPHEIHVFSEGSWEDFDGIRERAILHLDSDVFECFHSLISADIFVMAKSSFSYVAALLSSGVVIYTPFWHSPLCEWIVGNEHGSFLEEAVYSKLEAMRCFGSGDE